MILPALIATLVAAAAAYDAATRRIPNPITAALALAAVVQLFLSGAPLAEIGWHLAVGAAVFAGGAVFFCLRWIGGGDVKLLAATALLAGPGLILPHLLITSLAGGAVALALVLARTMAPALAWILPARLAPLVPALAMKDGVPYGVAIATSAFLLNLPGAVA
ncbi:MAG TPA: prepilin peptidase [Alphaproteobacteria bacterium]